MTEINKPGFLNHEITVYEVETHNTYTAGRCGDPVLIIGAGRPDDLVLFIKKYEASCRGLEYYEQNTENIDYYFVLVLKTKEIVVFHPFYLTWNKYD